MFFIIDIFTLIYTALLYLVSQQYWLPRSITLTNTAAVTLHLHTQQAAALHLHTLQQQRYTYIHCSSSITLTYSRLQATFTYSTVAALHVHTLQVAALHLHTLQQDYTYIHCNSIALTYTAAALHLHTLQQQYYTYIYNICDCILENRPYGHKY